MVLEWLVGHRSGKCWLLHKRRAAELLGECSACLYQQLWANMSRHGHMQKVGQAGYLGRNICLGAAGIRVGGQLHQSPPLAFLP